METSVRVVVANRRELVLSTLSGQEGISVVGETENEQDVPSLVAATKPDFLLIALDEPQRRPALCCCRSFLRSGLLQWLPIKIREFSTGLRATSIRGRWRRARRRCSRRCGIAWYRRREVCLEARVDFLVRSDGSELRGGARNSKGRKRAGRGSNRRVDRRGSAGHRERCARGEALQRTTWSV
jgi:hypothetical protein